MNNKKIDNIDIIKKQMVYVAQFDDGIYEDLTVREQLVYTAKLSGIPEPDKKAEFLMKQLNLLHI